MRKTTASRSYNILYVLSLRAHIICKQASYSLGKLVTILLLARFYCLYIISLSFENIILKCSIGRYLPKNSMIESKILAETLTMIKSVREQLLTLRLKKTTEA